MDKVKITKAIIFIILIILMLPESSPLASSLIYQTYIPIVFKNAYETFPINCVPSDTPGYNLCTMDNGEITSIVYIPETWTDVLGDTWLINGFILGAVLSAAPNLSQFHTRHDAEGISFGVSKNFLPIGGYVEFLDYYTSPYHVDCTFIGRYGWDDGIYHGRYDEYNNCGTNGYDAYVFSLQDIVGPTPVLVLMMIQVTAGDHDPVSQALQHFTVIVH